MKLTDRVRKGEVVSLDGFTITIRPGNIEPGDTYLAEKNTGPKLLTAKGIHPRGYIIPEEFAYPYDTCDCVRVHIDVP